MGLARWSVCMLLSLAVILLVQQSVLNKDDRFKVAWGHQSLIFLKIRGFGLRYSLCQ